MLCSKNNISKMFISDAIEWGEKKLFSSGIENCRMEAVWLLSPYVGFTQKPLDIYLYGGRPLHSTVAKQYQADIAKRSKRVPLAYILGFEDFFGLEFRVNRNVLIPRQETEIVVEEALKILPRPFVIPSPLEPVRKLCGRGEGEDEGEAGEGVVILDIGTGCGNIAISIAKNCPSAKIIAIDISAAALKVARRNAKLHQVDSQITFLKGDLFSPLTTYHHASSAGRRRGDAFNLIVSNPPYIKTEELQDLQKEIQFEPGIALNGGEDGFNASSRIVAQAKNYLSEGGYLLLEIGYDQAREVKGLMRQAGFSPVHTVKDLSGIERVALGKIGVSPAG